jgi:hypothetical protein
VGSEPIDPCHDSILACFVLGLLENYIGVLFEQRARVFFDDGGEV